MTPDRRDFLRGAAAALAVRLPQRPAMCAHPSSPLDTWLCVDDAQAAARRDAPAAAAAAAALHESPEKVARFRAAIDGMTLHQHLMVDVSHLDLTRTIAGVRMFAPIVVTRADWARIRADGVAEVAQGVRAARAHALPVAADATTVTSIADLRARVARHGRGDVLIEAPFRRGTEILMALALGAQGVIVNTAVGWGLAGGGTAGVRRVLELLQSELAHAMASCGRPTLGDITSDVVRIHRMESERPG